MSEEMAKLRDNLFIAALAGGRSKTEKRNGLDSMTRETTEVEALTLESLMALAYDIKDDNNVFLEKVPNGLDKVTVSGDSKNDYIIKSNFSQSDTTGERQKVIQGLITRASELRGDGKLHFFILDGGTSSNPEPNTTHTSLVASCGDHIYFLDPDGYKYGRFPEGNIETLDLNGMKTHTNLPVLQEDSYSCRNYVVEMMYILKDKFKDLGKDGFNSYMQNYFYEGVINTKSKKTDIMDNDEKSAIIPPEFAELSQGGNISFLKERVEACKSKIKKNKETIRENITKIEQGIENINSLSTIEKSIKKEEVQTEKPKETQTFQVNSEGSQTQQKQLQKQKEELVKTLITLQSRESHLNEIESTLEAVTQQKLENIKYGINDFIENRLNETVDSNEDIKRKQAAKQTIKNKLSELKNELQQNSLEDPTKICEKFLNKECKPEGISKKQPKTFAILKNVINDIKYGDKVRCIVNKRHLSHLEKLVEQEKKNMAEKGKDIGGIPPK